MYELILSIETILREEEVVLRARTSKQASRRVGSRPPASRPSGDSDSGLQQAEASEAELPAEVNALGSSANGRESWCIYEACFTSM